MIFLLRMRGASDSVLFAQMSTSDWLSSHPTSSTHHTAALTEPVYSCRVTVTAPFPEVGRALQRSTSMDWEPGTGELCEKA